jgi:hypothetical protein
MSISGYPVQRKKICQPLEILEPTQACSQHSDQMTLTSVISHDILK